MKLSYNWLKKYIETEVDIKIICNILTDIGFNVEKIKKLFFYKKKKHTYLICKNFLKKKCYYYLIILKKKYKSKLIINNIYNLFFIKQKCLKTLHSIKDYLLELNIPPNRGDIMSYYGIARDLNQALNARGFKSKIKDLPSVSNFKRDFKKKKINIKLISNKKCLRYTYTTICNINISDSPKWLKQYLKIKGCNTRNNILDIENYIMYELGQPIKIFDLDKILDYNLKLKYSKKKEEIKLFNNRNLFLSEKDIVIYNYIKPICLAGLLVDKEFVVNNKTKNLFIESADYESKFIYRTSKEVNIKNDSSIRFEKGLDSNLTIYALKRAALLIKNLSGGKISSNVIDVTLYNRNYIELYIRYKQIKDIIGFNINKFKIKKILTFLEFNILDESINGLKIKVPLYRKDISREIDVIEDILRIYGYNHFLLKHKMLVLKTKIKNNFKLDNLLEIENIISNQLNINGFYETLNVSLNKKKYSFFFKKEKYKKINVLNSSNKDFSILRFNLLFGILENISNNLNRFKDLIKIYEWGKRYFSYKENVIENKTLGIVLSYKKKYNENIFFYFKGVLEQLITKCNIKYFNQKKHKDFFVESGISFSYKNYIFCTIGFVKKQILVDFNIKNHILYANINWDIINIFLRKKKNILYKNIYNSSLHRRDISLLIDNKISFEEIKKISLSKKNIIKICLLDEYKSNKLPFEKKSYTLGLFFKKNTIIKNTINELKLLFLKKIKAKIR